MKNNKGTVIVEADNDVDDLKRRLHAVLGDSRVAREHIFLVSAEAHHDLVRELLETEFPALPLATLSGDPVMDVSRVFNYVKTATVGFLRVGASYTTPQWDVLESDGNALAVWVPDTSFPENTATSYGTPVRSWIGSTNLLRRLGASIPFLDWNVMRLAEVARRANLDFRWSSVCGANGETVVEPAGCDTPPLSLKARVIAIVPHYKCEPWLDDCLYSLVRQTQPLTGIVVVDDNSSEPPVEIVSRYPQVTLLRAVENSGPYKLTQQVINETVCDAYLFQDADDWASDDRVKVLLSEAERTGAELIGSQMWQVFKDGEEIVPIYYPLDVSQAYLRHQRHPIVHGTTLVTRNLVKRAGGFSTAMRFGGDSEFLRRVGFTARIVNATRFCYFQRMRAGSLTRDPVTGLGSPARLAVMADIREWVERNRPALLAGDFQSVRPYKVGPPVALEHLLGPTLSEISAA